MLDYKSAATAMQTDYKTPSVENSFIVEKRNKYYHPSSQSVPLGNIYENALQIGSPVKIDFTFPITSNKFIDTKLSYIDLSIYFDNPNQSQMGMRHIMDFVKTIRIYHKSGILLYEDEHINKHWLHDASAKKNNVAFSKIQKEGFGYPTRHYGYENTQVELPMCNEPRPSLSERVIPNLAPIPDLPWPNTTLENVVDWMTVYVIPNLNGLNARGEMVSTKYIWREVVNSSKSHLRCLSYVESHHRKFMLPLNWIPFFSDLKNNLLPPQLHSDLRLEITFEENNICLADLNVEVVAYDNLPKYFVRTARLNLCEIMFTPSVNEKINTYAQVEGLEWFFDNTLTRFKDDVDKNVTIKFHEPLQSVSYLKAIPYNSNTFKRVYKGDIELTLQPNGIQNTKQNNMYTQSAFSFNSNCSRRLLTTYTDVSVLFNNWNFSIGTTNYPHDKVDEKEKVTGDRDTSVASTYNELLLAHSHINKDSTITYNDFVNGACYQAVQCLLRNPGLFNSGLQIDRNHCLEFNATFHENTSIATSVKKCVYVFVTHLKQIICTGEKVVVKQ